MARNRHLARLARVLDEGEMDLSLLQIGPGRAITIGGEHRDLGDFRAAIDYRRNRRPQIAGVQFIGDDLHSPVAAHRIAIEIAALVGAAKPRELPVCHFFA